MGDECLHLVVYPYIFALMHFPSFSLPSGFEGHFLLDGGYGAARQSAADILNSDQFKSLCGNHSSMPSDAIVLPINGHGSQHIEDFRFMV